MNTNIAPFTFNSHNTYKDFVKEAKNKVESLIEEIRKEKYAIKQVQRKTVDASVSYKNLFNMRIEIQNTEKVRAQAKLEASIQYNKRIV